jgi:hypothetical protein
MDLYEGFGFKDIQWVDRIAENAAIRFKLLITEESAWMLDVAQTSAVVKGIIQKVRSVIYGTN